MKVLVSLSGGPQSLVTAWLLKKQGMQLRGVYFDLLDSEVEREKIHQLERKLGISIQILPFATEFQTRVQELQNQASLDGQTLDLKSTFHRNFLFPKLMELKENHQFSKVASGHRVLLQEDLMAKKIRVFQSDNAKLDEADLLLGLNQEHLGSLILPLGSIPESMLQKLSAELGVQVDHDEWQELRRLRTVSTLGFEASSPTGASLGLAKDPALVPGMTYDSLNAPGVKYRIVDISYVDQQIDLVQESELQLEELLFEDCFWFGRGDLGLASLECGMRSKNHLKPIQIKLLQYEGNRLKGYLNQPLSGEEANIFKGETVLWIEGNEILGGGRVFRT